MLVCRYMATRWLVSALTWSIWLLAARISPLMGLLSPKSFSRMAFRFRSSDLSDLWNWSSFSSGSWAKYEAAIAPKKTRLLSANKAQAIAGWSAAAGAPSENEEAM